MSTGWEDHADAFVAWARAFRSHFRRRRDYPRKLAPYRVIRLRSTKEVEHWLATFD